MVRPSGRWESYVPHSAAQHVADLADRAARSQRLAHGGQQVLVGLGDPPHLVERAAASSAFRSARTRAVRSRCCCSIAGSSRWSSTGSPSSSANRLTPTITRSPLLDLLLPAERRLLDLALHEALLDGGDGAAELVDTRDQLLAPVLELVGERLEEECATERIGRVGRARLVHQHLLRAQRERGGVLGREGERLVEAVRVQRLRAAADGGERLHRDADDVRLGLLRGERRAPCLRVEAQRLRARVCRAEAVAHDSRPQPPCRAELRDLLEEVVVGVEEEGQPLAERVG